MDKSFQDFEFFTQDAKDNLKHKTGWCGAKIIVGKILQVILKHSALFFRNFKEFLGFRIKNWSRFKLVGVNQNNCHQQILLVMPKKHSAPVFSSQPENVNPMTKKTFCHILYDREKKKFCYRSYDHEKKKLCHGLYDRI